METQKDHSPGHQIPREDVFNTPAQNICLSPGIQNAYTPITNNEPQTTPHPSQVARVSEAQNPKRQRNPDGDESPTRKNARHSSPEGISASIHNPNPRHPLLTLDQTDTPMEEADIFDEASGRKIISNRITTSKGLTYSAPPPDGFPSPQITRPYLKNVAPQLACQIEALGPHTIWVRPWKMRYLKKDDTQEERDVITKVLTDFFERDEGVILLATNPSPSPAKKVYDATPWYYLVPNLSSNEYELAVKTQVIASSAATLFVLPFTQQIPPFVMLIKGIGQPTGNASEGLRIVKETVQKVMRDMAPVLKTTLENLSEIIKNPGIAITYFIDNIYVNRVSVPSNNQNNNSSYVLHWSISSSSMPPFKIFDSYLKFIEVFDDAEFQTLGYGVGKVAKGYESVICNCCKSSDHPEIRCPFPSIPGWLCPTDDKFPWSKPETERNGNTERGGKPRRGRARGRYPKVNY